MKPDSSGTSDRTGPIVTYVAGSALFFSVIYFASDAIEAAQGGFSDFQLTLTLIAEAAVPFFVIALYLVQRPAIGRLGLISSAAYAYAYAFFTYTVIYALVENVDTYKHLSDDLGLSMFVHGVVMVLAGLGLGVAIIRAGVLPAWTGVALIIGVVAVSATQGAPEGIQLVAAGIRALAFAGMGLAVIRSAARTMHRS